MSLNKASTCPCREIEDINLCYSDCCEPLHTGLVRAVTPEKLMRSRYSAFVMCLYEYLINTHHPSTLGALKIAELEKTNKATKWLGLRILSAEKECVSFQVYFRQRDELACQHEQSKFKSERMNTELDCWYYLNGYHNPLLSKLPSRRALCFCGSNKKYKHCHGHE